MVCTENDLSNWENFPKGLRVLLLDADVDADTTSKLKSMDYIVTTFMDENEALSAFSKKPENFHIAIVEVNTFDKNKSFKFLESVKNLPTIMTSRDHCLTTMMKCIALGAVEFLHKPLSEDKLKNIWQHVVHKAFNDDGSTLSGSSLKPVKESVVSMLHFEMGNQEDPRGHEINTDDKDPAPSTPQLKQGSRLMDDGDCQENANSSSEKEDNVESKSVETTNRNEDSNNLAVKEEGEGETDDVKSENDNVQNVTPSNKPSGNKNVTANKGNRKKVDWTPELHKKFVQAVEQLGVDQAIPSRILELMKVEGLTRHNVASHLQKFRMHRRNILPKDDHDRRWIQPRDNNHHNHHHYHLHRQMHRSFNGYSQRPVMAYPAPPMYPVWGMPGVAHPPPVWPPASCNYPPWQTSDGWYWKPPYPPSHGNAWGCPVGPPAIRPCNPAGNETGFRMPTNSVNFEPDEEIIDMVVKEAMSKPWLPLPLGLKPPSPDSVLAELSRQGISAVPSPSSHGLINGSRLC